MTRTVLHRGLWLCMLGCLLPLAFAAFAAGAGGNSPENASEVAEVRKSVLGVINTVGPCGDDSGGPKNVTFTARASYAGVNGEKHAVIRKIMVTDLAGHLIGSNSETTIVTSGETGCVACPVSFKQAALPTGIYLVQAVLIDQPLSPMGPQKLLDLKVCGYSLSK